MNFVITRHATASLATVFGNSRAVFNTLLQQDERQQRREGRERVVTIAWDRKLPGGFKPVSLGCVEAKHKPRKQTKSMQRHLHCSGPPSLALFRQAFPTAGMIN
jgi:hypothetical protein